MNELNTLMADCSKSTVVGRVLHSRVVVSFVRLAVSEFSEALGRELSGTLIPHMSFGRIQR